MSGESARANGRRPRRTDGKDALLANVDRHHAEIGLIQHVQHAPIGVQRQVAREAVLEAVLVQIVDLLCAAGSQIHQSHAARVALRGVHRVLGGERQSHEHTVPGSVVFLAIAFLFNRLLLRGDQLAHGPYAALILLEYR